MGTKWKSFSTNVAVRVLVFVLAVGAITAAVLQIPLTGRMEIDTECLWIKDYTNSETYHSKLLEDIQQIEKIRYNRKELTSPDFLYYISNGRWEYTNTGSSNIDYYIKNSVKLYLLQNNQWEEEATGEKVTSVDYYNNGLLAYLAYPDTYFIDKQEQWHQNRSVLLQAAAIGVGLALFGLLLIGFLVITAGRKKGDKQIRLAKFDRVYSDISLAAFVYCIYLFFRYFADVFNDDTRIGLRHTYNGFRFLTDFRGQPLLSSLFFAAFFALFTAVVIFLLLSLIRKARAGVLLKHSLIYTTGSRLYKAGCKIYEYIFYEKLFPKASLTEKLYCRQVIFLVITAADLLMVLITAIMKLPLVILPIILEIIMADWYIRGNKRLYVGIEQGISDSMEEKLKSERMKVALITNVSHDLKTPLTSIISYAELLSKEADLSETAVDYVKILQAKSERLKNIVVDLFELAKSTSGDIALEFDTIDLKRLIEQTLAEFEDRLADSGLQLKVKLWDTPVYIKTDGKKLYRVFQNILDNAVKYSMRGTRVYIELELKNNQAVTTIKNIAAYEMNFTPEEIMQRFYRGDPSRTQEGSGLGLSIAESFTKNCGGEFTIEIDGDMFKIGIAFELAKLLPDQMLISG